MDLLTTDLWSYLKEFFPDKELLQTLLPVSQDFNNICWTSLIDEMLFLPQGLWSTNRILEIMNRGKAISKIGFSGFVNCTRIDLPQLSVFTRIQRISLKGNFFTEEQLTTLSLLPLRSMQLYFPDALTKLQCRGWSFLHLFTSLTSLSVEPSLCFVDDLLETLPHLTNIHTLSLGGFQFKQEEGLTTLATLPRMTNLSLYRVGLGKNAELFKTLTSLKRLSIRNCSSEKPCFQHLSNLHGLQSFNCTQTFTTPPLTLFTALRSLMLSCNIDLDEMVAIGTMTRLEVLHLDNIRWVIVSGYANISKLTRLVELRCVESNIDYHALEWLSCLKNLQKLAFLRTYIREISQLHFLEKVHLKLLELEAIEVSAAALESIGKITTMTVLTLNQCHLARWGLDCLSRLTGLARLSLENNGFIYPSHLAGITSLSLLKTLSLSHNMISDDGLDLICKTLTRLKRLDFEQRPYTMVQSPRHGIFALSRLQWLREYYGPIDWSSIAKVSSLQELPLNPTDDISLGYLAGHPSLTSLTIASSAVTSEGLSHLKSLPKLHELNMYHFEAPLKQEGFEHILHLTNLTNLSLSYRAYLDKDISQFKDMKSLNVVRVADDPDWEIVPDEKAAEELGNIKDHCWSLQIPLLRR